MADGVLGLGSSGSTGLSMDVIEKLKNAERKAQVEPIETRITNWDTEVEQFAEFTAKKNELWEAAKKFDLFSADVNAFSKVYATTSGTAASFDSTDTSNLKPGTVSATISQIAQKDVYRSDGIANISDKMRAGSISIKVGDDIYAVNTTNKSYTAVVAEFNTYSKLDVSLEKVSDNEYRMVIKSAESGLDNALTITQSGAVNLGLGDSYTSAANTFVGTNVPADGLKIDISDGTNSFSYTTSGGSKTYQEIIADIQATGNFTANLTDGKISIATVNGATLKVNENGNTLLGLTNDSQTQKAQNMLANVDGIDYNLSSNKIIMQSGLTITALETGTAAVGIQRDTTGIEASFKELLSTYNDLVDLVTKFTSGADSKIEDKATIRSIMSQIKDMIFGSNYGDNNDKTMFNYGMNLDKTGYLTLDSAVFNKAVAEDYNGLKSVLVGVAENKGIGTSLKEYIDELDRFGSGLLTSYEDNMTTRKVSLEQEKKKAVELLDSKYSQMASQFAAYTAIISQFENAFSGLKMMIAQSTVNS